MATYKKSFTLPAVSAGGLKKFAFANMLFLTAGLVIEKNMLTGSGISFEALRELFASEMDLAGLVIASLVLQIVGGMCVPAFAFLTVLGFSNTSRFDIYAVRVGTAAVIAEPFFDRMMTGSFLALGVQNPAFTVLLILIMLYLMRYVSEKLQKGVLPVQLLIAVGGILWAVILRLYCGLTMTALAAVFYIFRDKNGLRVLLGLPFALLGGFLGQGSFLSGLTFYGVYFYDSRERKEGFNARFYYIGYVAVIAVSCIAAMIV